MLREDLEEVERLFGRELEAAASEPAIRAVQAAALRRLNEHMKAMRDLAPAERREIGMLANKVKAAVESQTEKRLAALVAYARKRDLERTLDVTLPGRAPPAGHLHILTQVRRELEEIFSALGFAVASGPQVETDWHNFE